MNTDTKHTPTPWAVDGRFGIVATEILNDGKPHVRDVATAGAPWRTTEDNVANAAFIVKAANSHDALVAAAKWAIRALETKDDAAESYALRDLEVALKLAEGK